MDKNELERIVEDRAGKNLTGREFEVLRCLILGKSNTEIADDL